MGLNASKSGRKTQVVHPSQPQQSPQPQQSQQSQQPQQPPQSQQPQQPQQSQAQAHTADADSRTRSMLEVIERQYPGMLAQQRQEVQGMSTQQKRVLSAGLGLH